MNCIYCSRKMKNKSGLVNHEKYCKSNVDRVKRILSEKAGIKKGNSPWNKGKKIGRGKCWDDKFPLEKILVENSTYARHSLKDRILHNNLIEYECKICKIGPEWNDKPMPLILDHINGVNNDNRLENLRFVCSNCDTQLPTYKSKNKK